MSSKGLEVEELEAENGRHMFPKLARMMVVLLQETKGVIRDDRGHLIHNLSHPQAMAPDHVRGRRPGHPK